MWWTNVLWVNNLYPANIDDKCLPWTFFMPIYMQLSLALPPVLWIYTIIPNNVVKILYVLMLTLASLPATFMFVKAKTNGSIELNEAFLNDVFMNPLIHLSSFLFGMATCLIYRRYMEDRATAEGGNSSSSRTFEFIAMNVSVRYPLYLVALGLMVGPIVWMNQLVMGKADGPFAEDALVSFAFPMFCLGLALLVLPALGGKAQLFRFLFASEAWTMMAQLAPGLCYSYPMVALFYFLSSEHQIQFDYYMMVYYFSGNFIFGMVIYTMVLLHSDRPIYALKALKWDLSDAEDNELYRLDVYIESFRAFADAAYDEILDGNIGKRELLIDEHNEAFMGKDKLSGGADSLPRLSDDNRDTVASAGALGRGTTNKLVPGNRMRTSDGRSILSVVTEEKDDAKSPNLLFDKEE